MQKVETLKARIRELCARGWDYEAMDAWHKLANQLADIIGEDAVAEFLGELDAGR